MALSFKLKSPIFLHTGPETECLLDRIILYISWRLVLNWGYHVLECSPWVQHKAMLRGTSCEVQGRATTGRFYSPLPRRPVPEGTAIKWRPLTKPQEKHPKVQSLARSDIAFLLQFRSVQSYVSGMLSPSGIKAGPLVPLSLYVLVRPSSGLSLTNM